jgi:hypothetical protein
VNILSKSGSLLWKLSFGLIILSFFVSAKQIEIVPTSFELNGWTNQSLCKDIEISSDYRAIFILEDRWAEKSIRDLEHYVQNKSYFSIAVQYPNEITVIKNATIQACFTFNNSGEYNGALIFLEKEGNMGVGSWIKANIIGNNYSEINERVYSNLLTGAVVKERFIENGLVISNLLIFQSLMSFLLLILMIKLHKKVKIGKNT